MLPRPQSALPAPRPAIQRLVLDGMDCGLDDLEPHDSASAAGAAAGYEPPPPSPTPVADFDRSLSYSQLQQSLVAQALSMLPSCGWSPATTSPGK